jgi:hypothetical protein
MALTRKFLSAMGIEEDKIEQIIDAHTETVTALKEARDSYKADAEKLADVEAKLKDANEKLKDVKPDEYKDKYEKVKADFDKFKADTEAKESRTKKEDAYKSILKDANIPEKHFAKIIKYSDIDGLELDDKGEITNKADLLKSIKEEWADHTEQVDKKGANVQTPPASGGQSKMSKEEIMKIKDTQKRQEAIAENHELFGF